MQSSGPVSSRTIFSPFPDIGRHLSFTLFASNMTLGRKHKGDVIVGGVKDGGEFCAQGSCRL